MTTPTHPSTCAESAATRSRRFAAGVTGFTLLEVMFSVMILGVGLVAVAAIFPIAAQRQKENFEQIVSAQIVENVKAMMLARLVDGAVLTGSGLDTGSVEEVPAADLAALWPVEDRSFPTTVTDLTKRTYYCLPLVRKSGDDWQVFVFIMRRPRSYTANAVGDSWVKGATTVKMISDADEAAESIDTSVGDYVLVNDGTIKRVATDNADNTLWHVQTVEKRSPFRQIVALGSGVVR